jgi:phosphate-selective porin OprO/OprP
MPPQIPAVKPDLLQKQTTGLSMSKVNQRITNTSIVSEFRIDLGLVLRTVLWCMLFIVGSRLVQSVQAQAVFDPLEPRSVIDPLLPPGVSVGTTYWNDASRPADMSASAPITNDELLKRIEQIEKEYSDRLASEKKKKDEDKKKPVIKPRGRLHTDANWFHQSPVTRQQLSHPGPPKFEGDIEDGVFMRRARLGFDGSFMENTEVRLDYELGAPGHPNLFDGYGNLLGVPFLGTVRLGQFREPFSLEAQTGSNFYTFMERAFNTSFDPSRNWGIMFYNHNSAETITWAVGAFRDQTNFYGADASDSGGRAVTTRTTWLPYFDDNDDGDNYWEIGASYSFRDPRENRVNYPVKPLNYLYEFRSNDTQISAPNILQLFNNNVDSVQLFGFETTRTIGPWNLQGEYIATLVELADQTNLSHGSYAQASYFLTGEHRRWNRTLGTFGPTKVNSPFLSRSGGGFDGSGAWEVAFRWSDINIQGSETNRGISGYARGFTAALNWYLNDNVRLMINASPIQLHSKSLVGDLNVFQTRMDIHF